jgi:RHS repeat-associated protein
MRMCRGTVGGLTWRFVYNGDRVLELTDDANTPLVRYATENGSYYSPYLRANIIGNWCSGASIRYPIYDGGGNFTWLVDVNGGICDHNQWDAFGLIFSDPSPQNYSWGGAWGYMEERPGSGLVQLGARWYWPELGRFIQQDPVGDGMNWYAYAGNDPVTGIDPEGLAEAGGEVYGLLGGGGYGGVHNGEVFVRGRLGIGLGGSGAIDPFAGAPGCGSYRSSQPVMPYGGFLGISG